MHETAILLHTSNRGKKGTREGKKGAREGKKGTREGKKGTREGKKGTREGKKGTREGREGKKGAAPFYFGLAGTLSRIHVQCTNMYSSMISESKGQGHNALITCTYSVPQWVGCIRGNNNVLAWPCVSRFCITIYLLITILMYSDAQPA